MNNDDNLTKWRNARDMYRRIKTVRHLSFYKWIEEQGMDMFDDSWTWQRADGIEMAFAVKIAIKLATQKEMENDGVTFNYPDDYRNLERAVNEKMRWLDKRAYPQLVRHKPCSATHKGLPCPKHTYHHSELCLFHRG